MAPSVYVSLMEEMMVQTYSSVSSSLETGLSLVTREIVLTSKAITVSLWWRPLGSRKWKCLSQVLSERMAIWYFASSNCHLIRAGGLAMLSLRWAWEARVLSQTFTHIFLSHIYTHTSISMSVCLSQDTAQYSPLNWDSLYLGHCVFLQLESQVVTATLATRTEHILEIYVYWNKNANPVCRKRQDKLEGTCGITSECIYT